MKTLHVRNVPPDLHERILRLAQERNRSLSAEVVDLLDQAVHDRELRRAQTKVLADMRRNRFKPKKGQTSAFELLREDRSR